MKLSDVVMVLLIGVFLVLYILFTVPDKPIKEDFSAWRPGQVEEDW